LPIPNTVMRGRGDSEVFMCDSVVVFIF